MSRDHHFACAHRHISVGGLRVSPSTLVYDGISNANAQERKGAGPGYRLVWATLKTIASSAILDLEKFLSYPFTANPPCYFSTNRKLMKRPF